MGMAYWDKNVAPVLRDIEELSGQVVRRAAQIKSKLNELPARPTFVTKAEVSLDDAQREITEALRLIRRAREVYNALPSGAEKMEVA